MKGLKGTVVNPWSVKGLKGTFVNPWLVKGLKGIIVNHWSVRYLKGTDVNRGCSSLNVRSLEIKLTVPLRWQSFETHLSGYAQELIAEKKEIQFFWIKIFACKY